MRRLFVVGGLMAAATLSGCDRDLVAKVGGTEIDRAEVSLAQRQGAARSRRGAALDAIVEQTYAAEAARRAGLEKDPEVVAWLGLRRGRSSRALTSVGRPRAR